MHNSIPNYTFKENYALGKNSSRVIVWLIVSIIRFSSWEKYVQECNWNFEVIWKANLNAKGTNSFNAQL